MSLRELHEKMLQKMGEETKARDALATARKDLVPLEKAVNDARKDVGLVFDEIAKERRDILREALVKCPSLIDVLALNHAGSGRCTDSDPAPAEADCTRCDLLALSRHEFSGDFRFTTTGSDE